MIYQFDRIEVLYKAVEKLARKEMPAASEELTQETMIKLWSRRERLPQGLGLGLLKIMVRHTACEMFRKNQKLQRNVSYDVNDEDGAYRAGTHFLVAESVEDSVEQRDSLRQVEEAIRALSKEHSLSIRLRAAGLQYQEIALRTGVPVNTVRTRLCYARRHLCKILGEE